MLLVLEFFKFKEINKARLWKGLLSASSFPKGKSQQKFKLLNRYYKRKIEAKEK